ncbi:hypothetical protein BU17DRAFT_61884 [Hysterangium stoloniferum]|nr:hypothetical protein BU17DRAFT_61884 [Hysterangium stoloniferum]
MSSTWSSIVNRWANRSTGEAKPATRRKSIQLGFKELVPCDAASVDIVAIHGLNGDREESWTADNGRLWLRDFLSQDMAMARILTYGYDAYVHGRDQLSEQTLNGHARDFVAKLVLYRKATRTFALINSSSCNQNHLADHRTIYENTKGIIFIGTPNEGTKHIHLGADVNSFRTSKINNKVAQHLESNSEMLQRQIAQYLPISRKFKTYYLHELLGTPISGCAKDQEIVTKDSAVLQGAADAKAIGLHKTHEYLGKFESKEDDDYRTVLGSLYDIIDHQINQSNSITTREEVIGRATSVQTIQQPVDEVEYPLT